MSKPRSKFSAEVRERAVRMVEERRADYGSEWKAHLLAAPATLSADNRDRLK